MMMGVIVMKRSHQICENSRIRVFVSRVELGRRSGGPGPAA